VFSNSSSDRQTVRILNLKDLVDGGLAVETGQAWVRQGSTFHAAPP
jgi:hypothetical protein